MRMRQSFFELAILWQPGGRGFWARARMCGMIRRNISEGRFLKSFSAERSRKTSCTLAALLQEVLQLAEFERSFSHRLQSLQVLDVFQAFQHLAIFSDVQDDGARFSVA